MLSDELSKQHLLDICLFRLGLKNNYSNVVDNCPQYFNELTLSNKDIQYIDGGAYNGDSYKHLLNVANVTDAYLFEPDLKNYNLLVENINSALCIPLALSDNYRILSFNADNGEGSSISSQGSSHIAATSIDNIIGNKLINFIKLDVEGAEVDAINGARNVIKNNRPVLAISLYHKPQDLWEIPFALLDTCKNYSFYIRQHYYNSFDSVLYAVPL
jgi:FkbM family methyltransferase